MWEGVGGSAVGGTGGAGETPPLYSRQTPTRGCELLTLRLWEELISPP